uniref:AIG1-type G domain-containing protein n=1 Tax=Sander lucioperca TaxID=283035 RepID=A0A8C9Y639_SANLU
MQVSTVVLIGLPGTGRSSSGNTILGSDQFKSGDGFNPVTTETASKSARVEDRQVTVVDTPGITDLTGNQLYEEILKSVVEASPGPHAFVIVVRIDRITEADIKLFKLLEQMFGGDVPKYSMVLFTHGDELKEGQSIDGLIQSNQHVKDLVFRCGGRFCVFDNKTKIREHFGNFLRKVDEIVSGNGGLPFNQSGYAGLSESSVWDILKRLIVNGIQEYIKLRVSLQRSESCQIPPIISLIHGLVLTTFVLSQERYIFKESQILPSLKS